MVRGLDRFRDAFSAHSHQYAERLPPASGQTLTPIPFDDPVSSLSAILLDETYYAFLKGGVRLVEGISVVGPEHLVPLKARAWLDLSPIDLPTTVQADSGGAGGRRS